MKIGHIAIYVVALCLSLIVLAFGLFMHWLPNQSEKRLVDSNIELLEAEANKMPQAKRRVEEAKRLVEEKAAAWRTYVADRTPPKNVELGGIDLGVSAFQLTVDTRKFRNNMMRALNAQLKKGGVQVVGPSIPFPGENDPANSLLASYYNYPAIAFPVVIHNLGQVSVTGTYTQIMNHVRSWKRMPKYLAVTDGLQINGTAPTLNATYNLTILGFIRGNDIFPPVPEGGVQAAGFGGAAPGGFGGPPPGAFGGGAPGAFRGPPGGGRPGAVNPQEGAGGRGGR